jgi:hypothetical protein
MNKEFETANQHVKKKSYITGIKEIRGESTEVLR